MKFLKGEGIRFNYIYLDPPFRQDGYINKLLESIDREEILAKDGLIIIEHESELSTEDEIYRFIKVDSRKYGSKTISFYEEKSR